MTLYYDAIVAGEQIRTGKLRLYEPHVKNIIVNTAYACLTTYVTARFVYFSVRRHSYTFLIPILIWIVVVSI
jgi:hypothetical protein